MQVEWTIEGESGQGWDEVSQTLEYRKVAAGKIDFRSLEADTLTLSVVVEDATTDVFTATPTCTPDSSVRTGATVDVVVACATPGAVIRYTTDGSDPDGSSTVVADGATLTVANPSTLKVRATSAGALASDIKVAQYVLQGVVATGGTTVNDSGGYRVHTFLESGSFVVTNGGSVDYLVVGGGGSGGANSATRSGGGGGAGGLLAGTVSLSAGTYAITVGAGGQALITQTSVSDGGSSSIGATVTVTGGGAGASVSGTSAIAGRNGGSGGGGCCGGAGGTRVVSQGNVGGSSGSSGSANAGTGGGSTAAGTSVNTNTADGGAGTSSSITGTATTYAVGGGVSLTPDVSVVANSGRGGAGARLGTVRLGANGSSGIVVIRYALAQPVYPSNIPSTDSSLPTLRQEMTLFRDGVQFFHGNVTNVRSIIRGDSHEHQVTVSGPWWFLEKVPFTSLIADGTGVSDERISYVFGTSAAGQDLKTSIESAIDRTAALGCPIATIAGGSSVAAMTTYPRITLNQMTCGQAIAELVRLCPDAMVYFDYSVKPAEMHVVRRPTCPTTSFDEDTAPITTIDINPVIDLEVSQVKLPAVSRSLTGLTVFNNQTAGADPSGVNISARQVITIAGPELDTFLPNDLFDSQTVVKSTSFSNLAHDSDSACVGAAAAAGLTRLPILDPATGGTYIVVSTRAQYPNGPATIYTPSSITIFPQKITDANNVVLTNHSIITSDEPADWTGVSYVPVTVTGTMVLVHYYDNSSSSSPGYQVYPVPAYIAAAGFTQILSGFTGTSSSADTVFYYGKPYSYSAFASPGVASSQTYYKPADYSFINPPAGLAAFLLSTQNWVPYDGNIVLEEEDVGATRYVGTKVNITNSLPAFSTMGALVASESIEIESGRTTITLGAPPRNDYRTLVDKIRKTSQDNIVYV